MKVRMNMLKLTRLFSPCEPRTRKPILEPMDLCKIDGQYYTKTLRNHIKEMANIMIKNIQKLIEEGISKSKLNEELRKRMEK